ncbi:MAG TPA: hypothetical protein VF469_22875, partial [Kofleriaceae bacterium]
MSRGWLACALFLGSSAAAAGTDPWAQPTGPVAPGRTGPALEVSGITAKLALPEIPSFALPTWAGGIHHPLELLVAGGPLRGKKLRVGGYVTWISDCLSPCKRSRFALGDAPDTPPDRGLWVVGVPAVPRLAAGAYVEVTGALAIRS